MCTAISFTNGDNYFGRNLDLDYDYQTRVIITPREYEIKFTSGDIASRHYAIIGMAIESENYPLYFDATNEKGLSCAALRFTENLKYSKGKGQGYVASYEFILWVLSLSDTVKSAKEKIKKIKISDMLFSENYAATGLHFLISDSKESITVEQTASGLKIYENPFGVLTNNPEFPFHRLYINNFAHLSNKAQRNNISDKLELRNYSNGLGAFSLPGDFSSFSRFVRAVFLKENSVCKKNEEENVAHFFHILNNVAVPSGSVLTQSGRVHKTIYSSCCNVSKGIYYYMTYNNLIPNITDMYAFDLDAEELIFA